MAHYRWGFAVVALMTWTLPLFADAVEDEKLFQKVMNRLTKNELFIREYPKMFAYPPKMQIKPNSVKEMNAYASASKGFGAEFDPKQGKIRPIVTITQGYMERVVQGDEASLAVIMGHELAHLTKNHVVGDPKGDTAVLLLNFGRDEEIEADLNGMRYAIAGGYPYKKGIAKAFQQIRAVTKYSSFEGLSSTHPSWEERLVLLDREQAALWSAMSAFQNGKVFLEMEQYLAAQQCYRAVVNEFPDCAEGWANLGYARLMQYCDALDADDLKSFGIGHMVAGAFYTRPESLEAQVRAIDTKLWKDAVTALNRALSLNPKLGLSRASLGVAYLVHPDGKDVKKARKQFEEALDLFTKDPELSRNGLAHAALLINAGVADLAAKDVDNADRKFNQADKLLANAVGAPGLGSMDDALLFNQALILAVARDEEKKRTAHRLLEGHLNRTSPGSGWWPMAFERYTKLNKELNLTPRPRSSFLRKAGPQELRVVASVPVGKRAITLSEPIKDVVERLGADAGEAIPLFPDSKIMRWRFLRHGIDLLAKEKVLAIFLMNAKAPPVVLQQYGVAGDSRELKVGMSESAAREALKDQRTDPNLRYIADTKTAYHFYPALGLGLRYEQSRVAEIAIAQIPRSVEDRGNPANSGK